MFHLNLIHPKMKVKVIYLGNELDGEVLQSATDPIGVEIWWVEVLHMNGLKYVEAYYEKDLIKWNYLDGLRNKCDCGSEKLKHPGHSTWCKKFGAST